MAMAGWAERPEEIRVFADGLTRGATPLPRVTAKGRNMGGRIGDSALPVRRVEFNFTRATGWWGDRTWTTQPAAVAGNRATAAIPRGCTVSYFNVFDGGHCVVSSEHVAQRGA